MTPPPRLAVHGLVKSFGPTRALRGVSLEVRAGEVHALVGENGAGKSTLVGVLSGAVAADAGEILLDGRPYRPTSPAEAARCGVAMVYQELSLALHLSVAENILLGREDRRAGLLDRRAMRERARREMAGLGHGDVDPDTRVGRLPIAIQQLVEIARALSRDHTRVLILDEPTSSLAARDVDRLFAAVDAVRRGGVSVVYISHVLEEVSRLADRITVLRDGQVVATDEASRLTPDAIVVQMTGRAIDPTVVRSRRQRGRVVLEVEDLAGVVKPTGATLSLCAGEVLGLAGLVGAGRTELLRAIFGLDPVRRGQVRVGAIGGPASPWRRLAQGVGLLSEDRKGEGLALGMSVADNLTLSSLTGLGPGGLVLRWRQHQQVRDWIDRLGIRASDPDQPVWQLSGGNQQKVALARLLRHGVHVLLLDEPTRGIDVASKAQIYDLVDRLASSGTAVLVASSYLPELLGLCDRVAVLTRGRLAPARSVEDWNEHTLLMEAMGQA